MKESKNGFEDSAEAKEKGCDQNKMKFLGVMSKAEILKKLGIFGEFKDGKLKGLFHVDMKKVDDLNLLVFTKSNSSQSKVWALRVTCFMLLWTIIVVYCRGIGDEFKPTFFFFNTDHSAISPSFPPQRIYENNGYLMVSSNGGLNQMRAGICDMVAIARYLNVTFIVPELDSTSFWNDPSQFRDIFDVDYFINSLRDEVQILKEQKIETESLFSMPPVSWSNMIYYFDVILPHVKTYGVVHFTKADARVANNGIPEEVQRLRCRVNYQALRFTPPIEQLANKIVRILKERAFLVSSSQI